MKSFKNKNIVITGGSSGIGLETAFAFSAHEANIFLISRNINKLRKASEKIRDKFHMTRVEIFSCDVRDRPGLKNVIEKIGNNFGGIDILINNAGEILCGRFEDQEPERSEEIFNINFWGMLNATRYALPWLKVSKGHIAFVSSVAGFTGLFGYTHYAPSKFAITGLAECLRMEMKDYEIGVTIIYPPDTKTPMLDYEQEHTLPECIALSEGASVLSTNLVADKLVKGIQKNRFNVYCNAESMMISRLKGIWPGLFFRMVDGIIRKSRKKLK